MAEVIGGVERAGGRATGTVRLEMRSPDGPLWSGRATAAVVPGTKGSMGILSRHAPLMSSLETGLTRIREECGSCHDFVTGPGFVEVCGDTVLLLVDFGDRVDAIDAGRAEAARDRARARLASREDTIDRARARAALERALARLRLASS